MVNPTATFGFPVPTFASAVAKGEGETCRSFCVEQPSLSADKLLFRANCGAGDILRAVVETERGKDVEDEDKDEPLGGGGETTVAGVGDVDPEASLLDGATGAVVSVSVADGVSNSTGFFLGVACTLVMSFAREQ